MSARSVFTIIENAAGDGLPLLGRAIDDANAGNHVPVLGAKNDAGNYRLIPLQSAGVAPGTDLLPVAGFRDNSGNLFLPQLDANNKLPVSLDDPGTIIDGYAKNATPTADAANDVLTLALNNSETYNSIKAILSCNNDCEWEIVHNDNGSETVIAGGLNGPGQVNAPCEFPGIEFTSGATGTQELIFRATPDKSRPVIATASVLEKA